MELTLYQSGNFGILNQYIDSFLTPSYIFAGSEGIFPID